MNDKELSFRSRHVLGSNIAFVDGSIRFIHENIDAEPWAAVGSRNGKETNIDVEY